MHNRWRSLTAPWLWLAIALAISAGLAASPPRFSAVLKQAVADALAPGQRWALRVEQKVRQRASHSPGLRPGVAPENGSVPGISSAETQRLRNRIHQLEQQLAQQTTQQAPAGRETPPLIDSRLVTARVLGQQARQFLTSRSLLDVGSRAGLTDGALALEPSDATAPAPLLDVGGETGAAAGRLVLDSRTVVGRLSEVGRHTSCLERITDTSYRDLVRIVQYRDGRPTPGPRGLLIGTGEAMCRVRMVDISQPVSVGDVVLADGLGGILSTPPRYGTVVRVAQSPGSAQWDIWVQPDVDVRNLDVVSVLTTDVSSVRVAGTYKSVAEVVRLQTGDRSLTTSATTMHSTQGMP
ncbi:MAG: hypothetical protein K8T91_24295 [Planctomycetes bacterium]|nr:hypothetical protein [Planctomycetota bacterium]